MKIQKVLDGVVKKERFGYYIYIKRTKQKIRLPLTSYNRGCSNKTYDYANSSKKQKKYIDWLCHLRSGDKVEIIIKADTSTRRGNPNFNKRLEKIKKTAKTTKKQMESEK